MAFEPGSLSETFFRGVKIIAPGAAIAGAIFFILPASWIGQIGIDASDRNLRLYFGLALLLGAPIAVFPISKPIIAKLGTVTQRLVWYALYLRLPSESKLFLGKLAESGDDYLFCPKDNEAVQRIVDAGIAYISNSGDGWIAIKLYHDGSRFLRTYRGWLRRRWTAGDAALRQNIEEKIAIAVRAASRRI